MKRVTNLLLITMLLFTIVSCQPDDTKKPDDTTGYYTGVLVSNEGVFTNGTGDITYYNDATGTVEANIFEKINSRPTGNVVQSVKRHGDYTIIVANNSGKVEIVSSKTFKSVATLKNVVSPRYYMPVDAVKGYLTSWNGNIYVIDIYNMAVVNTIKTGKNSDQIIVKDGAAWILNSGGFVSDNTISVINTSTDEVIQTIETEYTPRGIEIDANGKIWVLCGGQAYYDDASGKMVYITSPRLTCFDPTTFAAIKTIQFESLYDYVSSLTISKDKNTLYFVNNGLVSSFSTSASTLADIKLAYTPEKGKAIYAMKVNPRDGKLYYSNAKDYNSDGEVIIVNLLTGTKESSFKAGVIPGGFDF